jgi:hypothetical protein
MTPIRRIAADVGWLPISFVNAYFIGEAGRPWVLVDTGIPGRAKQILTATEARFGAGRGPKRSFSRTATSITLGMRWSLRSTGTCRSTRTRSSWRT